MPRLTADDLFHIASMGELLAGAGMSLDARQRVLRLHTALMLREINEATEAQRGGGVEEIMRMMVWFVTQGEWGIGAYCQGFVRVLRRRTRYAEQVALLTRSLLNGDSLSVELASAVEMELPDYWLVPAHLPELVRDFARALGRPCAVGTATAAPPELPEALARARRISRAAPLRPASARLRPHTLADVFVELAAADVPCVDACTQRGRHPAPA